MSSIVASSAATLALCPLAEKNTSHVTLCLSTHLQHRTLNHTQHPPEQPNSLRALQPDRPPESHCLDVLQKRGPPNMDLGEDLDPCAAADPATELPASSAAGASTRIPPTTERDEKERATPAWHPSGHNLREDTRI